MSLDLVAPGSLSKPGPIGRSVRLLLGVLCLYALWGLINIAPDFVGNPVGLLPNLGLMILFALCIFNYVVNIGFSKDWHRYPLILSLIFLLAVATVGYLFTGDAGNTRPIRNNYQEGIKTAPLPGQHSRGNRSMGKAPISRNRVISG